MNGIYDINRRNIYNSHYGPYGSRATNPSCTLPLPTYPMCFPRIPLEMNCCPEPTLTPYLTLVLPPILYSNIPLGYDVNICVQTIPLVVTYNRKGELPIGPGYLLRNQEETNATVQNVFKKESLVFKIDSHIAYGETFPPVDLILKYVNKLETISEMVTGDNGTIFNVVIVYSSKCQCQDKDNDKEPNMNGLQFRQTLSFKVVSISVIYTV